MKNVIYIQIKTNEMYNSFKQTNITMTKTNLDKFLRQKRIDRISRLMKELCEPDYKHPKKLQLSPKEKKTLKNQKF